MKNQSGTIKTNLELYRVVKGGSGGYRRLPGGSDDFSLQTDRHFIIIYISSSPSLSFALYHERYSQSPLSDKSRQDRPQQWAALNQPSNTASARDLYVVGRIWVYLYLGVFPLQCGVDGVNLIGIPGSLALRTSVSPLSSKAPTPRNTKFKRNTTTQEGGIHKYQNTGRWKRETHNVSNCTIVGFWIYSR